MTRHRGRKPVIHETAPVREPAPLVLWEEDQDHYAEEQYEASTQPGSRPRPVQRSHQIVYQQQPQPTYYAQQMPDPEVLQYLMAIHRKTAVIEKDTEYLVERSYPPTEITVMAIAFTVFIGLCMLALVMAPFMFPVGNVLLFVLCIAFAAILIRQHKKNKEA